MRQTGVKAPNNVLVVLQSRASLYRGASRTVGPQTHTRRLSMRFWLFEAAKRRTAAGGEAEDLLYRARGSLYRGLGVGRENSLRSWALAVRRVSPLLVIEVIDPLQHSEIALITAGFNMNASVLAKWHPGEVQRTGTKQHPAARQRSDGDLLALRISEARSHGHRFGPIFIKECSVRRNWSQLHSE